MKTQQTLVIFALVAAIRLVGVAANIMLTAQEAEAEKSRTGQCASSLRNSTAQVCRNLR
jgi:hypothetical protein